MYDEKVSKKANRRSQTKKESSKKKQKKQGSGVRTRGRIRKKGGGIRTRGGKRNWQYIPPEESTTEEVEHNDRNTESEEEDWECKACGEDNGINTCDWWFHIRWVNKSADDFFQCRHCQ